MKIETAGSIRNGILTTCHNIDGVEVSIESGEKIRLWGGWYKQDIVRIGEKIIGRLQTSRKNKRNTYITLHPSEKYCVLGHDIRWLIRQAKES